MRVPFHSDTLNKKADYNALIGDNVIVFLGECDPDPYRRIQVPSDWTVYTLIDRYLGVITANDYVTEYVKRKMKR